jgi:energy-coupling factor transporter transmembrane protein EcfT
MTREDKLYKVFNNVNDWLKFSESKNAMLIAFNGASIFGISRLANIETISNSSFLKSYLLIVIICLIFSTINCLISFAPRVKIIKGGFYNSGKIANVLFFEYLKGINNIQIIKEITGELDEEK